MFLSNRVEILFEFFKERLYTQNNPFVRRLVVIPSLAMKNWLIQHLAENSCKIAMGIEWYGPDEALSKLAEALTATDTQSIPSALEWSFAIEKELRQPPDTPLWLPVRNYLKSFKKAPKRAASLSQQLGTLFSRYSLLGGNTIQEWAHQSPKDWQEALWQNIRLQHPEWTDWQTLLNPSKITSKPVRPLEVHFFSISYLPALFFRFLEAAASKIPISFYQLSPCHGFWEYLVSDRESQRLQSKDRYLGASEMHQNALEELLRDKNPLLANFGRLGREMANLFEESSLPKEAFYSLPQTFWHMPEYEDYLYDAFTPEPTDATAPSLLEAIQADILLMRTPTAESCLKCPVDDSSLQIVRAASPLREVQQLHDMLTQRRIQSLARGDELLPQDILILVPDLSSYVPFIRAVFEEQEAGFPIRILEWTLASQSPLIQAYTQLLSLVDSRWECDELFQLLSSEAFCRKQNWSDEDLAQIKKWLEQASIWWGDTADHRDEILLKKHCKQGMAAKSEIGTWQHGFERLLCGLVLKDPLKEFPLPCPLENSKTPLLNHFLNCIQSLKDDLEPLNVDHTLTVADWCSYLNALFACYLMPNESSVWDREGHHTLNQALSKLNHAADKETLYPYESIKIRLLELLNSSESSHEEGNLAAVRIAGLLPMRTQPARVVAILGMDDESFPRKDPIQSLNKLVKENFGDYAPLQSDSDRYLFLEALLSAREALWISYTGFSNDGQEIPPSSLLSELLSHLNKGYQIGTIPANEACFSTPPFHAHDSAHFTLDSPFPSYSTWRYRLASAKLFPEKSSEAPYPKSFSGVVTDTQEPVCLDVKKLLQLARNPIEFHYREQFGLYIREKNAKAISEEQFLLSHLQHAALTKQVLRGDLNEIVLCAAQEGSLPLGLFGAVESLRILEISEPAQKWLKTLGIAQGSVFDIEISEAHATPDCADPHLWKLPPLLLKTPNQQEIKLIGRLEGITREGVLLNKKGTPETRLENLPLLMLIDSIRSQFELPIAPKILWAKDLKTWDQTPNCELLPKWIDYLFLAKRFPVPFIPAWVPYFIKADAEGLQAKMDSIGKDSFELDFYTFEKWLWHEREKPDAGALIAEWQPLAQELFPKTPTNTD